MAKKLTSLQLQEIMNQKQTVLTVFRDQNISKLIFWVWTDRHLYFYLMFLNRPWEFEINCPPHDLINSLLCPPVSTRLGWQKLQHFLSLLRMLKRAPKKYKTSETTAWNFSNYISYIFFVWSLGMPNSTFRLKYQSL